MGVTRWVEEHRHDVKFALRQMRSSPAFTAVAAMTLALGIGVNGAIFALVDATLLRPLPFPDPDRLVMIWEQSDTHQRSPASPPNILDWNERSQTFEVISAYTPNVGGMVMAGVDGTAETIPRQWVLDGFFDVLGVKPIVGRTFLPSDNTNRANVVVLNETFWRTRFGGDPGIVGREIRLDGQPEDIAREATSRHRFRAVLVMTFAGLALILAMVGVFGVLACSVQQRVRELGVRRALGANTNDVLRLVVGSAVPVIAAGIVIGLGLAAVLGRLLATMLFGVQPSDPLTFISVTIVFALTVTIAIAGPAWRTARIDPASALRME